MFLFVGCCYCKIKQRCISMLDVILSLVGVDFRLVDLVTDGCNLETELLHTILSGAFSASKSKRAVSRYNLLRGNLTSQFLVGTKISEERSNKTNEPMGPLLERGATTCRRSFISWGFCCRWMLSDSNRSNNPNHAWKATGSRIKSKEGWRGGGGKA
jgi:hypothetical protein